MSRARISARLDGEVELRVHECAELIGRVGEREPAQRAERAHRARRGAQQTKVEIDRLVDARVAHLHGDARAAAVGKSRLVDLRDAPRPDRRVLKVREKRARRRAKRALDRRVRRGGGVRRHAVVQLRECDAQRGRQQVGPGRRPLAQLHQTRAAAVERGEQSRVECALERVAAN